MNREKQTDEIYYQFCPSCKTKLTFEEFEKRLILTCLNCNFKFWNNPKPVVSAIIMKKNTVLLVKRNSDVYNNYWSLPGGIINFLETPEDALVREVAEETGLIILNSRLTDAYLIVYSPNSLKKLPSHTSIDLIYKCKIKKTKPIMKDAQEIKQIKYFSILSLPQKIAFEHRKIINTYCKLR